MRSHKGEPAPQRVSVWPTPAEGHPRDPRPPGTFCYLLDVDTDLAEEFDPRMRMVVRQIATVPVVEAPVGDCQLWSRFGDAATDLGLLVLDGVVAVDVHVGDRTATELIGAGDLLQPWGDGEDDLLQGDSSWHVVVPARFAVLDGPFAERVRPWPQLTYALLRRAARRTRDLGVQRAITSHPRLEVRLALMLWHLATRWGRVEPGGIHLTLPLTHRLLGQLVGRGAAVGHARPRSSRGRRARQRRRRRLAPARNRTRELRVARRPPSGARAGRPPQGRMRVHAEFSPRQTQTERTPVHVVWMTSGLGCDGDSVALTSATSPSLEELLRGAVPGMPPVVLYNPLLAYETGADFVQSWYDAEAGKLDPFLLVLEGSVPNEEINGDGHWAGFGVDPETGQPITTCEWIDRLAPRAAAVMAVGTCAAYGGIPAMKNNPTGAMGLGDYLGRDFVSTRGIPIVNLPGLSGPARQHHRDADVPRAPARPA